MLYLFNLFLSIIEMKNFENNDDSLRKEESKSKNINSGEKEIDNQKPNENNDADDESDDEEELKNDIIGKFLGNFKIKIKYLLKNVNILIENFDFLFLYLSS
jgi:hypothetical protein